MTREAAERECAERNRAAGDAEPGVHWLAREATPGDWRIVRVVIPGARPRGPLKTTTVAPPTAEQQPDLRPLHNPLWGGPA